MDPFTLGLGALSFAGGLFSNKSNEGISAKQMAFQERMSNTSYQRGMDDMKAAGLNPMLAYKQGGAPAPSGAGIPAKNPAEGVPQAVQAGTAKQLANAQVENLKSQTDLNQANAALSASNSALALERLNTEIAQQGNLGASAALSNANTLLTEARTTTELTQNNIAQELYKQAITGTAIKWNELTVSAAAAAGAAIERSIDENGIGTITRNIDRMKGGAQMINGLLDRIPNPPRALRNLASQIRPDRAGYGAVRPSDLIE